MEEKMSTPMQELTKLKCENLHTAAYSNAQIKLKGNKYYVGEGKKRYLWLATRMGMPTVKDVLGIEILQTYNLLTHDQIVGMVMKFGLRGTRLFSMSDLEVLKLYNWHK